VTVVRGGCSFGRRGRRGSRLVGSGSGTRNIRLGDNDSGVGDVGDGVYNLDNDVVASEERAGKSAGSQGCAGNQSGSTHGGLLLLGGLVDWWLCV
jgi:hypothetical protein